MEVKANYSFATEGDLTLFIYPETDVEEAILESWAKDVDRPKLKVEAYYSMKTNTHMLRISTVKKKKK